MEEGFEETDETPVDPDEQVEEGPKAPIYYSIVGNYELSGSEDNDDPDLQFTITFVDITNAAAGRSVFTSRSGKEC